MPGPHRWGKFRGRGRPPIPRFIHKIYDEIVYVPINPREIPAEIEVVEIYPDELEALRLVYVEGRTQEEAALMMGISRGTLWRLLERGRRKMVRALTEGRAIGIVGSARKV